MDLKKDGKWIQNKEFTAQDLELTKAHKYRPKIKHLVTNSRKLNSSRDIKKIGTADSDYSLVGTHPQPKCRRIPCLNEHCARARKFAHKTFSCSHSGHNTARCHPLQNVLGIPGYEMAIVDNIPLIFNQLEAQSAFPRNPLEERGHTSFLMIAPKLEIHIMPTPLIL